MLLKILKLQQIVTEVSFHRLAALRMGALCANRWHKSKDKLQTLQQRNVRTHQPWRATPWGIILAFYTREVSGDNEMKALSLWFIKIFWTK